MAMARMISYRPLRSLLACVILSALLRSSTAPAVTLLSPWIGRVVGTLLWAYLILLPLARVGQSYNMFAKKALPGPIQALLDFYTNVFGLILWRVFSADHTNFVIRIYSLDAAGRRALLSNWEQHARYSPDSGCSLSVHVSWRNRQLALRQN